MTAPAPLVSIGIPTYNRAATVERAIRSALAQDHPALEVVVSDDGSSDGTEAVVRALAADDARLRYVRQPANLGHARNFQAVLERARGEYFMWLSDDDWIDPAYVSRCLGVLVEDPRQRLVLGLARYRDEAGAEVDERPTDLRSGRPGARLLGYLLGVNMNGALFGMARRADLLEIGFADIIGGDWRLVAALASRGRVTTLRDVRIYRSMDGLSADAEVLGRSFGMRGLLARRHHYVVAARLARDVAAGGPAYAPLRAPQRIALGALAGVLVVVRFPVHLAIRAALVRLGLEHLEARAIAWVRRRD